MGCAGEHVVFVAAGAADTVAVTAGGRLYTWGSGNYGHLGHGDTGRRLVPTLVGAGAFGGSAVVMAGCGLEQCGLGGYAQLGLNDEASRHVSERVGPGAFGGARVVAAAAVWLHSTARSGPGATAG